MKIWLMSDLHVDSNPFDLSVRPADADVLVIAGDIADGHHRTIRWLQTHAVPIGIPVLLVLGNHEFAGFDFHDLQVDIYEKIGVTLLHAARQSTVIGGVRFVGSTLWTDFQIAGDAPASMSWFDRSMPDSLDIDIGMRRLRARDVQAQHHFDLAAIEGVLTEPFHGPTVVVTHHGAHRNSLADPDSITLSDGSFSSDMTNVMLKYRPQLWLHGHTHISRDFQVGDTRVVANQRGYSEGHRRFFPNLVIDV